MDIISRFIKDTSPSPSALDVLMHTLASGGVREDVLASALESLDWSASATAIQRFHRRNETVEGVTSQVSPAAAVVRTRQLDFITNSLTPDRLAPARILGSHGDTIHQQPWKDAFLVALSTGQFRVVSHLLGMEDLANSCLHRLINTNDTSASVWDALSKSRPGVEEAAEILSCLRVAVIRSFCSQFATNNAYCRRQGAKWWERVAVAGLKSAAGSGANELCRAWLAWTPASADAVISATGCARFDTALFLLDEHLAAHPGDSVFEKLSGNLSYAWRRLDEARKRCQQNTDKASFEDTCWLAIEGELTQFTLAITRHADKFPSTVPGLLAKLSAFSRNLPGDIWKERLDSSCTLEELIGLFTCNNRPLFLERICCTPRFIPGSDTYFHQLAGIFVGLSPTDKMEWSLAWSQFEALHASPGWLEAGVRETVMKPYLPMLESARIKLSMQSIMTSPEPVSRPRM